MQCIFVVPPQRLLFANDSSSHRVRKRCGGESMATISPSDQVKGSINEEWLFCTGCAYGILGRQQRKLQEPLWRSLHRDLLRVPHRLQPAGEEMDDGLRNTVPQGGPGL